MWARNHVSSCNVASRRERALAPSLFSPTQPPNQQPARHLRLVCPNPLRLLHILLRLWLSCSQKGGQVGGRACACISPAHCSKSPAVPMSKHYNSTPNTMQHKCNTHRPLPPCPAAPAEAPDPPWDTAAHPPSPWQPPPAASPAPRAPQASAGGKQEGSRTGGVGCVSYGGVRKGSGGVCMQGSSLAGTCPFQHSRLHGTAMPLA
jgi:hypothetical protein